MFCLIVLSITCHFFVLSELKRHRVVLSVWSHFRLWLITNKWLGLLCFRLQPWSYVCQYWWCLCTCECAVVWRLQHQVQVLYYKSVSSDLIGLLRLMNSFQMFTYSECLKISSTLTPWDYSFLLLEILLLCGVFEQIFSIHCSFHIREHHIVIDIFLFDYIYCSKLKM